MGQGGGRVPAGRGLLPPGFVSLGTGDIRGKPDVRRSCGCHTTPWRRSELMGFERDYHLCPMHDMVTRRKLVAAWNRDLVLARGLAVKAVEA